MQKIATFLWFDGKAEEAMNFYCSVFKNSKILSTTRYGEGGPGPKGSVMIVKCEIEGQVFLALNGGPEFKFNPAISLVVNCTSQQEIDDLLEKLSEGGEKNVCGWLTDKYGLSWQVVPAELEELISDTDPERSQRVMNAIESMTKLDIAQLKEAYEGKSTFTVVG